MSKSILSLPPVLQGVWRDVYAATIAGFEASCESSTNLDVEANYSEERAWEAVRRANGGEMPEEASTSSEPTDEEMVEALAPIVAKSRHGEAWNRLDAYVQAAHINDIAAQLRTGDSTIARIAIASWKAARAWGRK